MYVCGCAAVTDRTVHAAIAAGARSVDDLRRMCRAGDDCGNCWPTLREMLAENSGLEDTTRMLAAGGHP